ncbi:membrane protein insertase YidC, partial [bacterium]|nr:membrane protein insertase YidC [candidate division CSSED10-310 bacterium]
AVLERFELKKYLARNGNEPVENGADSEADKETEQHEFADLLAPESVSHRLLPLSMKFSDAELDDLVEAGNYSVEGPSQLVLDAHSPTATVRFTRTLENGFSLDKEITFTDDSYLIDARLVISNYSATAMDISNRLMLGGAIKREESAGGRHYGLSGPLVMIDGQIEKTKVKKLTEAKKFVGHIHWLSLSDIYFFIAMIPGVDTVQQVELAAIPDPSADPSAEPMIELGIWTGVRDLQPHSTYRKSVRLYFGPKQFERLQKVGFDLDRIIDFGTFAILARPLLKAMNAFYGFTGNYGVAIILLTIIIKLVFTPLTHFQMKSMRKMQELQPEVNKIKNKYKKEPQKANEEMMRLYKQHGANPASGCLPMIIQIPVFFALYSVLMQAIELRGAPFIFWLTDLSAKDPTKITPILMGVSMFFQQRLTPSTSDAKQKQIFMLMPIFMTFLFINFPSGLVIYWLVSNLLSLGYQGAVHLYKARKVPPERPATGKKKK